MKVIGVVGQNGSGKDEVIKYLNTRYGVPLFSSGDMVREIAARNGIETIRTNLQNISEKYFQQYGKGCFMKLIAEKIRQECWKTAGITGIRSPEDVAALRNAFGKDFILLHVYVTDPLKRYERMRKRGESRDVRADEEFQRQDAAEEQLFHISETVKLADRAISNDGTLDDLHHEIEQLISGEKWLTA